MQRRDLAWKGISYGAGALATVATQRVLSQLWGRVANDAPPDNPADRSTDMLPALSWAIATGVGIGVMRLIALRSAARVWEVATNAPPPTVGS